MNATFGAYTLLASTIIRPLREFYRRDAKDRCRFRFQAGYLRHHDRQGGETCGRFPGYTQQKVVMNKGFLQDVAKEAKCEEATVDAINRIRWPVIVGASYGKRSKSFSHYFYKNVNRIALLSPDGELTLLLISEEGKVLYQSYALETQHARYVSTPPDCNSISFSCLFFLLGIL